MSTGSGTLQHHRGLEKLSRASLLLLLRTYSMMRNHPKAFCSAGGLPCGRSHRWHDLQTRCLGTAGTTISGRAGRRALKVGLRGASRALQALILPAPAFNSDHFPAARSPRTQQVLGLVTAVPGARPACAAQSPASSCGRTRSCHKEGAAPAQTETVSRPFRDF